MALFKKKKKEEQIEELNPQAQAEKANAAIVSEVLTSLNEKLNGTLYDNCIIMPKGYTIDVQVGHKEDKGEIKLVQFIFIVKNDAFDEPLIDPVDAQGATEKDAAKMAADIFYAGLWHPIDQSINKKNPMPVSVDFLRQHYDFDMYCQSVVRIRAGEQTKQPVMLVKYLMSELPKYLGSKKYYWVRIYLARLVTPGNEQNGQQPQVRKMIEVRVNGSVCPQLGELMKPYIDSWEDNDGFACEKQYAIFVQREDDKCPFDKEIVMKSANECLHSMIKIEKQEDYVALAKRLEEMTGNKSLAAEIRIFIPEILAKITLGYREGDSLFLIEGEGEDQQQIEFKKTQLRSYFYLQQAILEFLSTRPAQEDVKKIVVNSVAFREMMKVQKQLTEQGKEFKMSDLFVPGTSYRIGESDYKVW